MDSVTYEVTGDAELVDIAVSDDKAWHDSNCL